MTEDTESELKEGKVQRMVSEARDKDVARNKRWRRVRPCLRTVCIWSGKGFVQGLPAFGGTNGLNEVFIKNCIH